MKSLTRISCLIFVLVLTSLTPVTANDYSGCPNTWPENADLNVAKAQLGPNMIVNTSTKISKYQGIESTSVPPTVQPKSRPGESDLYKFTKNDWYLYGKSEIEVSNLVEVKNCPNPRKFIQIQTPIIGLGFGGYGVFIDSNTKIEKVNSKTWSESNAKYFSDFKKQETFSQDLDAAIKDAQKKIDKLISRVGNKQKSKPERMPPLIARAILGPIELLVKPDDIGVVLARTPNCLTYDRRVGNYRIQTIGFGNKCEFALAVPKLETGVSKASTIYIFEPFVLDLTLKKSK